MVRVAVVGATGAVGREMLAELEEHPNKDLQVGFFASPRSAGERLTFRGRAHEVKLFQVEHLKEYQVCLMSAGGAFSKQYAQSIAELGVTVIDNSSAWRMDPNVPLVVPEVNGATVKGMKGKGIIANPNCSTIQLVLPLQALENTYGLEQVIVASYQSVSGTGQKGMQELSSQIERQFKFQDVTASVYAQPIAFNVLPAIDVLDAAGHCFEEEKIIRESRRIMSLPSLDILATTARVPTFHCHCEAVTVRLKKKVTRQQAMDAFEAFPGVVLNRTDHHGEFPSPRSVVGQRDVYVTRVRTRLDEPSSEYLQFWVVADNLRKGAATNAVQIMDLLGYN